MLFTVNLDRHADAARRGFGDAGIRVVAHLHLGVANDLERHLNTAHCSSEYIAHFGTYCDSRKEEHKNECHT